MTAAYFSRGQGEESRPADPRAAFRDFVMSRRARLTPTDVGLPDDPGRRRVAGLRREEVAVLATMSLEYYVQIERGQLAGVSDNALSAVMEALRFNEVESDYFQNLAAVLRDERSGTRHGRMLPAVVPPGLQAVMDSMRGVAAVVQNPLLDIVAGNRLGYALFAPVCETTDGSANLARFVFLDDRSRQFFPDWDGVARNVVTILRVQAGRSRGSQELSGLIQVLHTRSRDFAERWARHEVADHLRGSKTVLHPIAGILHLHFESLDVPGHRGELTMVAYGAEHDPETDHGLRQLALDFDG